MKVAVIYNEEYPELESEYSTELHKKLDFEPYFEIIESDPIKEYEQLAQDLRKEGFDAYILNLRDNIDHFFKE